MTTQRVLILGGTGFVGRHLCQSLSKQGYPMTVVTRRLPARSVQMIGGVSVVVADVWDERQLVSLMQDHDVVINLIAILHGNAQSFDRMHVQLPQHIAHCAKQAHLKRLIHVSALGAELTAPSLYQQSKAKGEAWLKQMADQHDLELTILRPSVIFGEDDTFINLFAKLQRIFPVMPLAGAATRFQPVWVGDVADAIGLCLVQSATRGQTYEVCGPEIFTLKELVQIAGRYAGHPRWVVALPYVLGYLQALLLEWAPGKTLMSTDNLASMKVDNISTQAPGLAALGLMSLKRLREVFPDQRYPLKK